MSDAMPNIEGIQTEAKRTFSLKDRLQNVRARQDKVLVYTDPQAAEEAAKIQIKINGAQNKINSVTLALTDSDLSAAQKKSLKADQSEAEQKKTELEAEMENAKASLLESSLAIHIVALPKIATDVANREARKLSKQADGTFEDQIYNTAYAKHLLSKAIVKIVDSSGAEVTDFDIDDLYELLPSTQWDRLDYSYGALQFTDSIAEATTDDPGF